MMRIAQKIANEKGCDALITGENIGQVASQTMKAIVTTNEVLDIPIFRPLIGMDKIDIINIAKKISEELEQQQIEKYWLDTLKKYKNPFLGLLSGFQKKDSAFFMLISCIVNDVLRDITIGYDTEIQTLNLKARRLFENLLLLHWINRHSPREVYIRGEGM